MIFILGVFYISVTHFNMNIVIKINIFDIYY